MPRFARVLSVFLYLAAYLAAQSSGVLYTGSSAVDRYTAADPTARFSSADAKGITLDSAKGRVRLTGPYLTYQDDQGRWQPSKPQISSDNAGGWKQTNTSSEISLVGNGATRHLKIGKGPNAWDMTLENAAHSKDSEFSFVAGGQNWRLTLRPGGFAIDTTVTARKGEPTYAFSHTPGSLAVSVDKAGNLLVGTIWTSRAVMLGADKRTYPCSPWSADKKSISFTCDDTPLPANAFPYIIDPFTSELTPDQLCRGQGFYGQCSLQASAYGAPDPNRYEAIFYPNLPPGVTVTNVSLSAGVLWNVGEGCIVSEKWHTPTGDVNVPPSTADFPKFNVTSGSVTYSVDVGYSFGGEEPCNAYAGGDSVVLSITYNQPPPSGQFTTAGLTYNNWGTLWIKRIDRGWGNRKVEVSLSQSGPDVGANACSIYQEGPQPYQTWGLVWYMRFESIGGNIPAQQYPGWQPGQINNASCSVQSVGSDVRSDYFNGVWSPVNIINIKPYVTGTFNVWGKFEDDYGLSSGWINMGQTTIVGTVATPTISPAAGTYNSPQTISLSTTTPGASIRYTTNGTDPTAASTLYTGPFAISSPTTVKAIGLLSGWINSPIATAAYTINSSITVTSSPTGRSLTVDGAGCTTPCTYQWAVNSSHTIAAAAQAGAAGTQYAFANWSDSGAASHSLTVPASAATYTANFTTQYYLTTSAGTGGTIAPASGWYNAGAVVSVSATPSGGYQFSAFSGGLSGATTPQNVTMNASVTVSAAFTLVPVPITVAASPTGRSLTVDATGCTSPCAFSWTPGSTHTIAAATQAGAAGTQYVFASWSDSGAASHTITTPSSAATYTANFTTQYTLTTSAGTGGSIAPATGWYNSGAVVSVSATPSANYQFAGFSGALAGTTTPQNVTMSAPATVSAAFNPLITVTTSPAGLSLTLDGTGCAAPCTAYWAPGSSHTIAGATQGDTSTQYVFASWSDSGAASHSVTVPSSPTTFTATFTTQYMLTTAVTPAGTGTISPPTGWQSSGAVVSVSATPTGSNVFSSFSGGLTGATTPQNLTVSGPTTVTANFGTPVTITLATAPSGLALTVDSVACGQPCTKSWLPGSTHAIATTTTQAGATGTQYVFANWSDTGAASHTITTPGAATTYTANFTTQYYLTTSAGAGGSISPASGWYNSGATVAVSATANTSYQFAGFSGALTGTTTPQNVTMSAPATVSASFNPLVTVTTSPAGLSLTVDGNACTAPCAGYWSPGSTHTVAAATQPGATGTQYAFANWSDSGAASHTITGPSSPSTYTSNFTTQYMVTTAVTPSGSGTIAPATGWQNSGTVVSVAATANTGYQFSNFSGDLTQTSSPQNLTVNAPKSVTANFVQATVATPTFSPTAGTYGSSQTITLSTTTTGSSIRYTMDGTTPTSTTGTPYTGPFTVTASATVKAIAYQSPYLDSAVSSAAYTLANAAPTFSPGSGTYTAAQTVTIATPTTGASIRYTTDGSTPTSTTGTAYSGPVAVSAGATLKAIAFQTGWTDSTVNSASYTFATQSPTFSPVPGTFTSPIAVTLSTTTSGASIRYTTDGSTPTATTGIPYTAPFAVNATATVKAIAYLSGWTDSAAVSASYTITGTVATPTFSVAPGTYTSPQTVTLTSATPGASIRYTTDGSLPTSSSGNVYSGSVAVSATASFKAIAYKTDWADSGIGTAAYTITGTVSTPALNPAPGTFTNTQTVYLTSATSGATIRYTLDGSTPTASSGLVYTSPLTVSSTSTIKAIAYKTDWLDSSVASGVYTMAVAPADFTPGAGTFTGTQSVVLSSATGGATIRYTTDGSQPSPTTGTIYSGAFLVSASTTVRAIAYQTGWTTSAVSSASYTLVAATPIFTPAGGGFNTPQTVSISTGSPGASIRYTTDGTTPTETAGTQYTTPIAVNANMTVKAVAYQSGWTTSAVAASVYSMSAATPGFSPSSGTYLPGQTVSLTTATPGATIRYTTDGSTPTQSAGIVYTAPIPVNANTTIRAIAFLSGYTDSAVASSAYTIQDFTISLSQGSAGVLAGTTATYTVTVSGTNGFNGAVTLGSVGAPPGVTISFNPATINGSGTSTMTLATASTDTGTQTGNYPLSVSASTIGGLAHAAPFALALQDWTATFSKQAQNISCPTSWPANPAIWDLDWDLVTAGVNGYTGSITANFLGWYKVDQATPATIGAVNFGPTDTGYHLYTAMTKLPPQSCFTAIYFGKFSVGSGGVNRIYWARIDQQANATADLTLTLNPSAQTVPAGGSAIRYAAMATASFGFSGAVSFSVSGLPSGITGSFTQTSYSSVNPGMPAAPMLTLTSTSAVPSGTYSFTVTATSSSQTKTASASLVVGQGSTQNYTVTTNLPLTVPLVVDGTSCNAPCSLSWAPQSAHSISAPSVQSGATGTRYVFTGWSDSGGISHSIYALAPTTYTANFKTQYFLDASVSPMASGSLIANPTSSDGWYDSGTPVSLAAGSPSTGFHFSTLLSVAGESFLMDSPHKAVAVFLRYTLASRNEEAPPIEVPGGWASCPYGLSHGSPRLIANNNQPVKLWYWFDSGDAGPVHDCFFTGDGGVTVLDKTAVSGGNAELSVVADYSARPGNRAELRCRYGNNSGYTYWCDATPALTVYDAPPVIQSICVSPELDPSCPQPPLITAGSNVHVSINGANFGNNNFHDKSFLKFTGPAPGLNFTIEDWSPQTIRLFVSTDTDSSGDYSVAIVSHGVDLAKGYQPIGGSSQPAESQPATVSVAAPKVRLTNNGSVVSKGQCVYLESTPSMPELTVQLLSATNQPVSGLATWRLTVEFDETLRQPKVPPPPLPPPDPIPPYHHNVTNAVGPLVEVPANQPFQLTSRQTPVFGGGLAKVNWTYNGRQQEPFEFCIRGTNPDLATAQTALNASGNFWFLWNTAIHETNVAQFCQSGLTGGSDYCRSSSQTEALPIFGAPGGYGMLQYDPDTLNGEPVPPLYVLWDWKVHISWVQAKTQAMANEIVYPFWISQVRQWRQWNIDNPQAAVAEPPQQPVTPSCLFKLNPSPTGGLPDSPILNQPGVYWFGDALLIKAYNGAPKHWLSWDNVTDPQHPVWYFNFPNNVNPDIVHDICTCIARASCEHNK